MTKNTTWSFPGRQAVAALMRDGFAEHEALYALEVLTSAGFAIVSPPRACHPLEHSTAPDPCGLVLYFHTVEDADRFVAALVVV